MVDRRRDLTVHQYFVRDCGSGDSGMDGFTAELIS